MEAARKKEACVLKLTQPTGAMGSHATLKGASKSSRAISEDPEIISGHLGEPRNHLGPSRRASKSSRAISEDPEVISGHLGQSRNHLGSSRRAPKSSWVISGKPEYNGKCGLVLCHAESRWKVLLDTEGGGEQRLLLNRPQNVTLLRATG